MGYAYLNLNPHNRRVGDCVIRAIAKAMNMSWEDVAIDLSMMMVTEKDIISSNALWGKYLELNGFERRSLPDTCPICYTIEDFAKEHPVGTFIVCTGTHVVAVVDGMFYDTFDSGQEVATYYFERMR